MTVFDYTMPLPDGSSKPLSDYQGQVLLIVNTASKCGFTPQYEGLEALHREYKDRGFEVLGFPCNQFGAQEPGDAEEIKNFCSLTYDVTFPLSAKIAVNGEEADPLWKYLKSQQAGLMGSRAIKWNFTKFLIDRKGNVVARYGSMVKPEQLKADIEKLL
ncbi:MULTISPECIES: glutathione peroxidase [Sphingomonadales]|jgi:glutathione peroxidase|uniref:glutathione peroxidase n=1 Tax=Sphingomonadales TaxID=204457 RepID=UPI000824B348|nr:MULTISPECIES: glutathione peroxidase [Sphingomonadales]MAF63008.1 glutathione peroxidase [Blastomonas sp.]|tara:strand:+ start:17807 stop:18283 length:477 start_codon:yes stop_codon:yes gene_type:complete